jgi:hypothetical protein
VRNAAALGSDTAKQEDAISASEGARVHSGASCPRASRSVSTRRTQAHAASGGRGREHRSEALAISRSRRYQSDACDAPGDREGTRRSRPRASEIDRAKKLLGDRNQELNFVRQNDHLRELFAGSPGVPAKRSMWRLCTGICTVQLARVHNAGGGFARANDLWLHSSRHLRSAVEVRALFMHNPHGDYLRVPWRHSNTPSRVGPVRRHGSPGRAVRSRS